MPNNLDKRSIYLRKLMLSALFMGGRGHLPSAFSITEILRVLYDEVLNINPLKPDMPDRDRFILSKGHGCLALYSILADKGFFPLNDLDKFCAFGSHLGGHPERGKTPGIEVSSGSLGHGLSLGVGMALALRLDKKSSRVFVLCGDGESNEGSVWEALLSAAKHKLDNLTLLIDYNKQQSWGDVSEIMPLEPYAAKFKAFGAEVIEVKGHDIFALQEIFKKLPLHLEKPTVIICHTVKGRGITYLEKNLSWHHKTSLSEEEYKKLLADLETEN